MRETVTAVHEWWAAERTVAMATVVRTFRSAPQPPGAAMLVGPGGEAVGSVSGGCVEGAVYELATTVRDGAAPTLQRYGVSDDDAFSVGLTCGGILDVFVEPVSRATFPELGALIDAVRAERPVALATVVAGRPDQVGRHLLVGPEPDPAGGAIGGLGSDRIDDAVRDDARGMLAGGRTGLLTYGPDGQRRGEGLSVFVHSYAPPPRMLVFGAIDFAAAVARLGVFLGYRVTVCDARPVFSTAARFPDAHEVVTDWPHRYLRQQVEAGAIDPRTVICVLTHDPKFDVPVLVDALRLDVAYVGAMGSRRTAQERAEQLRAAGLTDTEVARLASPIGLDLGARTPEETAVSIAAEIVARRWGGGGHPLVTTAGDIHRPEHPVG
ncbi:XdhC family protein [Nakamurella flava]|uniref:XdhC family protein n=1 Tax=Nakamurella flava TaxID=2576308 RepID=A0A4U6QMW3_9ACTN|nr:XdhC/CoxI family protein [Nakamurella flava]TKV61943.1 XdhC family protein [Nakamurella flava]